MTSITDIADRNEIFVDVNEILHASLDSSNKLKFACIDGHVKVKSFLKG